MKDKELNRMAREVIEKFVEIANEGKSIELTDDFGGNTLTIRVGNAHTHVGVPSGDVCTLIANLHGVLIEGRGLGFVAEKANG